MQQLIIGIIVSLVGAGCVGVGGLMMKSGWDEWRAPRPTWAIYVECDNAKLPVRMPESGELRVLSFFTGGLNQASLVRHAAEPGAELQWPEPPNFQQGRCVVRNLSAAELTDIDLEFQAVFQRAVPDGPNGFRSGEAFREGLTPVRINRLAPQAETTFWVDLLGSAFLTIQPVTAAAIPVGSTTPVVVEVRHNALRGLTLTHIDPDDPEHGARRVIPPDS